jgi:hypothetical protein
MAMKTSDLLVVGEVYASNQLRDMYCAPFVNTIEKAL